MALDLYTSHTQRKKLVLKMALKNGDNYGYQGLVTLPCGVIITYA